MNLRDKIYTAIALAVFAFGFYIVRIEHRFDELQPGLAFGAILIFGSLFWIAGYFTGKTAKWIDSKGKGQCGRVLP